MLLAGLVLAATSIMNSRLPVLIAGLALAAGGYQLSARGHYLMTSDEQREDQDHTAT